MTVRIVTDSTADIPLEQAKALGITVVPLTVFFGNEEFLDGVELDNATFYQKLQTGKVTPRTSQPPPAAFMEAYTTLINEGADSILSIHVSAKLSGTYQSARTGRDSLPDDLRKIPIEIVDSETVSMGMGYAVMQAAKEAQQGDSLEEIQTRLRSRLSRTQILFVLDTLEYLKRGGRVGSAKAFLGNMLSVKPILAIKNGMVVGLEQPRTRSRANARIAQLLGEMGQFEQLGIVESEAEAGQQLASALKEVYPHEIPTYKLGAAVGTYAGPGTAGVTLVTAE
ncbi:MAG TPA: DegV family protein [Ktedonobacteraceae bacterium]|nr:DegV family protein [Ktedonobacteraceae bacterium]